MSLVVMIFSSYIFQEESNNFRLGMYFYSIQNSVSCNTAISSASNIVRTHIFLTKEVCDHFFLIVCVVYGRKKRIEWISFIVFMYHNGCENDNVFLFSNHFCICLKKRPSCIQFNVYCMKSNSTYECETRSMPLMTHRQ